MRKGARRAKDLSVSPGAAFAEHPIRGRKAGRIGQRAKLCKVAWKGTT